MPQTSVWKGSVLIVEGDPVVRELYRSALRAAGFGAVAVSDGLDALRHLESAAADAVVLNLNLPRVSGRDGQQELHARPETRRIPIIVVTGDETSRTNLGDFACVLRKPFSAGELVAAVRRCVERHGSR
jgi:DNA-binding response OmpR family regulator